MQDFDNDGESAGAARMLHMMEAAGVINACVVVTRWYYGTEIGPDRFKHINRATRDILEANGHLFRSSSNGSDDSDSGYDEGSTLKKAHKKGGKKAAAKSNKKMGHLRQK